MGKVSKTQSKRRRPTTKPARVTPPRVPVWAIQPHLYQSLILKWFETLHAGLKEVYDAQERTNAILERIEAKMNKD